MSAKAATFLMFSVGEEAYRIELTRLLRVLPWATLLPAEARGVLGSLDLEGELIPVVDLRELLLGEPTVRCLGARILLLQCGKRRVGAVAEGVYSILPKARVEELERFDPCEVLGSILGGLR